MGGLGCVTDGRGIGYFEVVKEKGGGGSKE